MVGHDPDLPPAGREQQFDPGGQATQQFGDAPRQDNALVVARLVEVAELGPGSSVGVAGLGRGEELVALLVQELAEPIGRQVLALSNDRGPELLAGREPRDPVGDRRDGRR